MNPRNPRNPRLDFLPFGKGLNSSGDSAVLEYMLGYGNIATLIFIFVLGRVWFHHGPRIPLIFVGILTAAYLSFPLIPAIARFFPLVICFLAIALLLVETVKNNPWR